jgi:SET domain-containing protein
MRKRKQSSSPPVIKVNLSDVHGCGVYAARFIKKGTRIIEYTGQRIPDEKTAAAGKSPHTFYFGLENGFVIDPVIGGNEARWINHSCEPNCEAIEEEDRVFIYAMRNIESGEELFYDYALEIDEPVTERARKQYQCLCGHPSCRGTMLGLEDAAA